MIADEHLIVTRVLLGLFESGFFPAASYLLFTWYCRYEVQTRMGKWSSFHWKNIDHDPTMEGIPADMVPSHSRVLLCRFASFRFLWSTSRSHRQHGMLY